jgi:hypothetical protein
LVSSGDEYDLNSTKGNNQSNIKKAQVTLLLDLKLRSILRQVLQKEESVQIANWKIKNNHKFVPLSESAKIVGSLLY